MNPFEYRMQLFRDEMAHKEADRVPVVSNVWSWKIADGDMKLSEALYDYDMLKKNVYDFQEKYNFDAQIEVNFRNPLMISRALGGTNYIVDDEKNALTYLDQCMMEADEYDALIEDPAKYLFTTYLNRKYPGITLEKTQAGLGEMGRYVAFLGEIGATLAEKYSVPSWQESIAFAPIDCLGCGMRGLKNISIDLRRRESKVLDALNALNNYFMTVRSLYATAYDGPSKTCIFDVESVFLAHSLMTPKAFEKTYMPFMRELSAYAEQYHKSCFLFIEGDNARFYDFFNDLPKQMYSMYLEQDDMVNAKKVIGENCAIAGGFDSTLLASGTPEQCAEETRRLIDTLGVGGGYFLTTNKMITFRNDCKSENLKAINDACINYKG